MASAAPERPGCAPQGAAPGLAYTLTALALLGQNIEALIRLPVWAGAQGVDLAPNSFANVMLCLSFTAILLLVLGRTMQFNRPVQMAIAFVTGALLANVACDSVISLALMSPMPGLYSGLALVLPASAWLLLRLPLQGRLKAIPALTGAAAMAAFAAISLVLAGMGGV